MNQAIDDFGERAEHADLALFYYGGHGLQLDAAQLSRAGRRRAAGRGATSVKHTVPLDKVIDAHGQGRRRRLMFLDACRENPLKGADSAAAAGLARVGKAAASH